MPDQQPEMKTETCCTCLDDSEDPCILPIEVDLRALEEWAENGYFLIHGKCPNWPEEGTEVVEEKDGFKVVYRVKGR